MTCRCSTLNSRNMNWSIKKYMPIVCTGGFIFFDAHFLNVCHVQTTPKDFFIFLHEMLCY